MKIPGKQWLVAAALVAAILIAIIVCRRPRPELIYNGKPVSYWFGQAESMSGMVDEASATKAFRGMGAAAIPYLAQQIRSDPWWFTAYAWLYPKLPSRMQSHLSKPRDTGVIKQTAAMLLADAGLSARGTVPELIADYDHEYVRHYHLSTWWRVNWSAQLTNPPASMLPGGPVPVPEGPLRNSILIILTHIGGDDPRVAPLLLAAVHDHNMPLRDSYISWLKGNTNLASAVAVGEHDVIVGLGDSEAKTRAAAADMLGLIARNHPEVIAPLLKAAEDPDMTVRDNAMESLSKSTVKLEAVLPVLDRVWRDHPEGVRRFGMILLIKSGGGGAKFLPALNDELDNANPAMREAAARALGKFGPRAQLAVPRLRELTNAATEPADNVRRAAAEALRLIRP